MIDFSLFSFISVIDLPKKYEVLDFTKGYDSERKSAFEFSIGKYNEKRKDMYTADLFGGERCIHMGIDIGAPVGTAVKSFYAGEIFSFANNDRPGDYGYTLITKHNLNGQELFALFGHLSARSITNKKMGQKIEAGETIAWVGAKEENGGWLPHLHFQLSFQRPAICDMPGVVSEADREKSLLLYPDPQLVLGKLY